MKKILNNVWIIGIGTMLISGVILYFVFGIGKNVPTQNVNGSPCSVNTVGQSGGENNVNCGPTPYEKTLYDGLGRVVAHFTYDIGVNELTKLNGKTLTFATLYDVTKITPGEIVTFYSGNYGVQMQFVGKSEVEGNGWMTSWVEDKKSYSGTNVFEKVTFKILSINTVNSR